MRVTLKERSELLVVASVPPIPLIVLQRVNRDAWVRLSGADLEARRRRHQRDPRTRGQPFSSSWAPRAPMFLLGQPSKEVGEGCSMCLEELTLISVPWQLLCGHWYHLKCLQDLKKNGKHALIRDRCPTCRDCIQFEIQTTSGYFCISFAPLERLLFQLVDCLSGDQTIPWCWLRE